MLYVRRTQKLHKTGSLQWRETDTVKTVKLWYASLTGHAQHAKRGAGNRRGRVVLGSVAVRDVVSRKGLSIADVRLDDIDVDDLEDPGTLAAEAFPPCDSFRVPSVPTAPAARREPIRSRCSVVLALASVCLCMRIDYVKTDAWPGSVK